MSRDMSRERPGKRKRVDEIDYLGTWQWQNHGLLPSGIQEKTVYNEDPIRIITHDDWRICEYDDDYGWWPSHQHDKKWYECLKNNHDEFICVECHVDEMQFPPKALLTHIKLQKLKPKKQTDRRDEAALTQATMNQAMQFAQMQPAQTKQMKKQQDEAAKKMKQIMSPPVLQTPKDYKEGLWEKLYNGSITVTKGMKDGKAKK